MHYRFWGLLDSCLAADAGQLAQQLRAKGITLPLTDILIAVIAQRYALPVLTLDKHFQHLPVNSFGGFKKR